MTAEVWASETYAILEWQESSSDSDLLLTDIQSEQSNLLTVSYSCHREKTVYKGWMAAER